MPNVKNCRIAETPIAVLDFETTGLTAGLDRVVEVAVVRCEPDGTSRVVLDTLIHPERRVSATEIHGIKDEDVVDAPKFKEIAPDVARAIQGCVVGAFNVYFDVRFLCHEMSRAGFHEEPPHLCLMYLCPMLGLGSKGSLERVCRELGLALPASAHTAVDDAKAGAALVSVYKRKAKELGLATFGDLESLKSYKFLESFANPLPSGAPSPPPRAGVNHKPRRLGTATQVSSLSKKSIATDDSHTALKVYTEAIKSALSDLTATEVEIADLERLRRELALSQNDIRAIHGRLFAHAIGKVTEDRSIDLGEAELLRALHQSLRRLGWAPGD